MDYLCQSITYTVYGKHCNTFTLAKVNKTTATYEIRVTDAFAFRTYLPLALAAKLRPDGTIPKEICLLACLPENLDLCKVASFDKSPSEQGKESIT